MFRRCSHLLLILSVGSLVVASLLPTTTSSREPVSSTGATSLLAPLAKSATPPDTALIGTWTFDGSMGEADPQGWTTVDLSPQPAYFHVDDFNGLAPPLAPIEGAQSMWCGSRDGEEHWQTPPGFGNSWNQVLTSVPLATTGDVEVSYLFYSDTEPTYDRTYVQYKSKSDIWQSLDFHYSYENATTEVILGSESIPEDSLAGSVQVRFYFKSDGGFSDEDGLFPANGVLIDSLTVSDMNGVVDYQDFEAETPGATQTADGHWTATGVPAFGDYAALFEGTTVLQEDTLTYNDTHFWGFFNGSPATYACGGHPEQASLPYSVPVYESAGSIPSWSQGIYNAARSPIVSLTEDVDGKPVPWAAQKLLISYDIYRDIQCWFESPIAQAEFLIDGEWKVIRIFSQFSFDPPSPEKGWSRATGTFSHIPDEATHVRIDLGVHQFLGGCQCNSHWPLFDNVELSAITEFTVGATPTPTAAHLEQNIPNPFNPATTIRYTLSSPGPVSLRVYDVSGRLVRTLVDGFQTPDGGPMAVEWKGLDDGGKPVASGIYFYRLIAPGIDETRKAVLLK